MAPILRRSRLVLQERPSIVMAFRQFFFDFTELAKTVLQKFNFDKLLTATWPIG